MKTMKESARLSLALLAAVVCATVQAQDEEAAADLDSYSVGGSRPVIEQEKIQIERPKFENTFKLEAPKPSLSGMQIAKPRLQVMPQPDAPQEPVQTATAPAEQPAQSAGGASPAVSGGTAAAGDRPVQPLRMDPPEYPRDALRDREEGFVVVEFTVGTDGTTRDIDVVDSDPRRTFDREAVRAVSRWTFEPAIRDGRAVEQRIRHTLEFSLGQ